MSVCGGIFVWVGVRECLCVRERDFMHTCNNTSTSIVCVLYAHIIVHTHCINDTYNTYVPTV